MSATKSTESAAVEIPDRSALDTVEDVIKILGFLIVAGVALAASFTHVHDWTVRVLVSATKMPESELSWLGWVNACISELVPLLALLSLRRRMASGLGIMSYALALVIAGAVVSISAQLAWVEHGGFSAKFLACLPAFAFMALSKLVVSDIDTARARKIALAKKDEERKAEADRVAATIAAARKTAADAERNAEEVRAEAERAREAERSAMRKAEEAAAEAERFRSGLGQTEETTALRIAAAEEARATAERNAARAAEESARSAQEREALVGRLDRHAATTAELQERHAAELAQLRDQLAAATTKPARPARAPRGDAESTEPVVLANGQAVPKVAGVSVRLVAQVLNAAIAYPNVTRKELAQLAETTDRTVREVLNNVPEDTYQSRKLALV